VALDAGNEPTAEAVALPGLQHVELVELGLGRVVRDVPRRESREVAVDGGQLEPAAGRVQKAGERVERVPAFEHVLDLLMGDDAGIVGAPDDAGEPLHLGQLAVPRADDDDIGFGHGRGMGQRWPPRIACRRGRIARPGAAAVRNRHVPHTSLRQRPRSP